MQRRTDFASEVSGGPATGRRPGAPRGPAASRRRRPPRRRRAAAPESGAAWDGERGGSNAGRGWTLAWPPSWAHSSPRPAARLPGARARAGERLCADCTRALPWLRGGCPRCGLPPHRGRGCPAARGGVPAGLGASRLRGRRAAPRRRAEVPRRAAGRGRDGGAHGREPPAVAARPRRGAGPRARRPAAPPGARVRPGAVLARRWRAGIDRPLADCLVRADRSARQVGATPRGPPRAGPSARARARLTTARSRSSSTTSTRRARRSTPAPARSSPTAHHRDRRASATRARCEGVRFSTRAWREFRSPPPRRGHRARRDLARVRYRMADDRDHLASGPEVA